ncbi:MAG: hypothetical protein ACK4RK_03970 [Gemmataceae bacterium]
MNKWMTVCWGLVMLTAACGQSRIPDAPGQQEPPSPAVIDGSLLPPDQPDATLASLSGAVPAAPADPSATVVVKKITETRVRSEERKPFPAPGLNLTLVIQPRKPELLQEAVRIGNLRLSTATDDMGTNLISQDKTQNSNQSFLQKVSDFQRKAGAVEITVTLLPSARGARTFTLQGSIAIVTGGTPVTVDFPKVQTLQGQVLEHPELKAAGLKLQAIKPTVVFGGSLDKTVQLQVLEGSEGGIAEVGLVDAAGQYHTPQGFGDLIMRVNDLPTVNVPFREFDPNWTLRLKLLKGAKVVTVPIELHKIELP